MDIPPNFKNDVHQVPHTTIAYQIKHFCVFIPKKGGHFHISPPNYFFQVVIFDNCEGILGRKTQKRLI